MLQAQKGQQALERRVAMLETHQLEVHNALVTMENEAMRLHREEGGAPDEDARARDVMYERAERLASSLARMGDQLRTAIDNVNSASSASQGEGATPLGKVVRILNNQLQALSALDDRTEALDARTKHLPRGLGQVVG